MLNYDLNEIYICEAVCDAVREWSEVTRLSADCQTTIFRRFKQLEIFLKKVAERSRDNGRSSRDRRPTVKLDVSSDLGKILKKVAERSRDSGRRSRDCRPTVKQRFWTFQAIRNFFLKKVAERSRDSGRRSRDCRPTVQTTFFERFKQFGKISKRVAERSRDSG